MNLELEIESKLKLDNYSRGIEQVTIIQVTLKSKIDNYTYIIFLPIISDERFKDDIYIDNAGIVGISDEGYVCNFTKENPETEETYNEILTFCEEKFITDL